MTAKLLPRNDAQAAVEGGLLVYLILEPCQQLAARRPTDVEIADIAEQLRTAMAEAVEDIPTTTEELAVPIGAHAVDILRPLERNPTILKLLATLYLVKSLVQDDRFILQPGSRLDLATMQLIALLEREYGSTWDAHEKIAKRLARTLYTMLLKRGLFVGRRAQN